MTLVLTDVSMYGVAMAADSAVTFPSGRVYVGAQKLLPVDKINCGLSLWGRGDVAGTPADEWLTDFIEHDIGTGMSLWDTANTLADRLNKDFGEIISDRMGVHLGGFDVDQESGIRGAAFYHVHNGHYHVGVKGGQVIDIPDEKPPIRAFKAHADRPPGSNSSDDRPLPVRNGDILIFAFLSEKVDAILDVMASNTGFSFPYPRTLETRGEYLRFWINTVKGIYRLSNARPRNLIQPPTVGDASIGGPVTVLTISESGEMRFYAR